MLLGTELFHRTDIFRHVDQDIYAVQNKLKKIAETYFPKEINQWIFVVKPINMTTK